MCGIGICWAWRDKWWQAQQWFLCPCWSYKLFRSTLLTYGWTPKVRDRCPSQWEKPIQKQINIHRKCYFLIVCCRGCANIKNQQTWFVQECTNICTTVCTVLYAFLLYHQFFPHCMSPTYDPDLACKTLASTTAFISGWNALWPLPLFWHSCPGHLCLWGRPLGLNH